MGFRTLPASYYVDPEYFARELAEFYERHWVCIALENEVPRAGQFVQRSIGDESLIVTRSESGAVRAFHNVCRHRGTQICDESHGAFQGRIQCPYHAWTWTL